MTTLVEADGLAASLVVEAYRLDRYDNSSLRQIKGNCDAVVEAYRLDRYDNLKRPSAVWQ